MMEFDCEAVVAMRILATRTAVAVLRSVNARIIHSNTHVAEVDPLVLLNKPGHRKNSKHLVEILARFCMIPDSDHLIDQ